MKNKLGVEMTVLSSDNRTKLMKGMVLRRLTSGRPLIKHQLDTAIEQDITEITKRFRTFNFESYTGIDLDAFYTAMTVAMLIDQRNGDKEMVYERGRLADEFITNLTEELEWMVESLPMSTRGVFDNLKSQPSRKVTMSPEEYHEQHSYKGDETKKLIEHKTRHNPRDHQLKAGRAKKH